MATRAERFKSSEQRSGTKKTPTTTRRKPPAKSGLEQADEQELSSNKPPVGKRRVASSEHTAERNVSKRAAKKAGVALEDSATGTPPRKSTRSSANRAKSDSQLQRRAVRATTSPEARATKARASKAGAKAKKAR